MESVDLYTNVANEAMAAGRRIIVHRLPDVLPSMIKNNNNDICNALRTTLASM